MAGERLDIIAGNEYEKDGETKMRWTKLGAAFPRDDGGYSLYFDALPYGAKVVQLRKPFERDGQGGGQRGGGGGGGQGRRQEPTGQHGPGNSEPPPLGNDDVPF